MQSKTIISSNDEKKILKISYFNTEDSCFIKQDYSRIFEINENDHRNQIIHKDEDEEIIVYIFDLPDGTSIQITEASSLEDMKFYREMKNPRYIWVNDKITHK